MRKVLVLEDEENIRSFVVINLKRAGYETIEAGTGEEALAALKANPSIKVALLDIMLPGIDGFEVCRRIRATNTKIGIIMLTARSQEMDKVTGLMTGADDYVTKPFNVKELMARAHALLRRARGEVVQQSSQLIRGDPVIDKEKFTVTRDGKAVSLTPTEFNLLEVLASSPGRVFSRMQLMERAQGGYSFEGYERTIDTHIRNLRKKLERDAAHPEYILTVYGIGYKFGGTEYD